MKIRMTLAALVLAVAGVTTLACGDDDKKETLPCECDCSCLDNSTNQSEGKSEEDCNTQCYDFCGGEDQAFGTGSVCIE